LDNQDGDLVGDSEGGIVLEADPLENTDELLGVTPEQPEMVPETSDSAHGHNLGDVLMGGLDGALDNMGHGIGGMLGGFAKGIISELRDD
jgi:hypothetical protein